jgi:hypothetical protein
VMKRSGLYPSVHVDGAGSGVVSQAGGVLLLETVRASGLDTALTAGLARWRKPTAVHDPAKILLDLAVSLALGGDCLADIAVLRAEPGVYGPVASDPTVSRLVDALAADASRTLAAIHAARAVARARVWALAGPSAPDGATSTSRPLIIECHPGDRAQRQGAGRPRSQGLRFPPADRLRRPWTAPASPSRCCSARVTRAATRPRTT